MFFNSFFSIHVNYVFQQVWFQNRRAKEKRLKKDAGRQRWNPYFRGKMGHHDDSDGASITADDRRDDSIDAFSKSIEMRG